MNSSQPKQYRAGSLVYTKSGLVVLFGWLLWGDFVYNLMELVLPSLLPLLLKDHGASNRVISLITTSLYMVANTALSPIISYKSDRTRSRFGRRRPYIAFTTPFVVLFLAATPFAPEIWNRLSTQQWLHAVVDRIPVAPVILVFGVLVFGFQIFNSFVASVYYYLIADVVPEDHLGRFYALFRFFGAMAGMVFNFFLMGAAEAHMREIFVGLAILYGIAMFLMCARVKEGAYPPPSEAEESHAHWWSGIQNYLRQCFSHSFYWWIFLVYALFIWASASNVFMLFFLRDEIGLSLAQIGVLNAWVNLAAALMTYPFGVLLDRWGSHKTLITFLLISAAAQGLGYLFIHGGASTYVFRILANLPVSLIPIALAKYQIELYPRERYGQFGSAGSMVSCAGMILLGPLCGWLIDSFDSYRLLWLWTGAFNLAAFLAALVVLSKQRKFALKA